MPFLCCHWRCSYLALFGLYDQKLALIQNFAKHAIFVCCHWIYLYLDLFGLYVQKLALLG